MADQQAKEAANEMVGADPQDFLITMDKKEAVAEIKKNVKKRNGKESLNYKRGWIKYRKKGVGTVLGRKIGITLPC